MTNAKVDTTKVAVLANLALVTPTEVNKNPVTPVADVSVKSCTLEINVTNAKVDTGESFLPWEMNVSKVWKGVFFSQIIQNEIHTVFPHTYTTLR